MLRGVAALLVVVVHAINVSDWRVAHGLDTEAAWVATAFALNEFGASGVDLFFVISGFVMAMMLTNRPDLRFADFATDRLIRIVPLFWLASAAFAIASITVGRPIAEGSIIAALTIVPLPFTDYAAPVLVVGWSLGFELIFYGIVAASLSLAPRKRKVAVSTSMATAVLLGLLLKPEPGMMAYVFNPIMAEFLLGIGCFALWRKGQGRVSQLASQLLFGVGLFLLLRTALVGYPFATPHLPIIAGETGLARTLYWGLPWAIVISGLLLNPTRNLHPSQSPLHCIGDASYSLYLVHMVICLIAEGLVPDNAMRADLMVTTVIATSIAIGLATHKFVELPLLNSLRAARSPGADFSISHST